MALNQADIDNFNTLKRAALQGQLALMECTDAKTGEYRAVLCAVMHDANEVTTFVPFGHLCTGNPYDDYTPPQMAGVDQPK